MYKILKIGGPHEYRGMERTGPYPDMLSSNSDYIQMAIEYINNGESMGSLSCVKKLYREIVDKYHNYELVQCDIVNESCDEYIANENILGIDVISEDKWHSWIKHLLCAPDAEMPRGRQENSLVLKTRKLFLKKLNRYMLFDNIETAHQFVLSVGSVLCNEPDAYDIGRHELSTLYMLRKVNVS